MDTDEQPKSAAFDQDQVVEMTSRIVSAYVGNNPVPASELPRLIQNVHQTITTVAQPEAEQPVEVQQPAVSVRKSVTPDYIICLEDGKKFKSLKRHLRSKYNLSPEEYREKWALPHDYPMVAPNYAQQRSELAKKMGLGQAKK